VRDDHDILERRQFWPRPDRPEALGEIEFDQPCGNCGYNLRGLPPGSRCPECGSKFGLNLSADPIPWDDDEIRSSLLRCVRTLWYAIFQPHELARQIWAPGSLDVRSARRFRRVAIWVALFPLCAIACAITSRQLGAEAAAACLPFHAAAIVVFLNTATLEPLAFFRDKVSDKLLKRTDVLAHYASAPLLLLPLNALLLLLTVAPENSSWTISWQEAAIAHVALLLATMALGIPCIAWLMYETVDINPIGAFTLVMGRALMVVATALILLIGVPMMTAHTIGQAVAHP
jgi:hypothetical protein